MDTLSYILRKLTYSIPLILGVTFISFVLMVYFGPDKTYDLLGKNPTQEEIEQVRHQLGYDKPFIVRYGNFVTELLTFDFGYSQSSGEKVINLFKRTVPVSLSIIVPSLIFSNLLAILIAMWAGYFRGTLIDKTMMFFAVGGMSISILIIALGLQIILCSSSFLDAFPTQGWAVSGLEDYFSYATVPVLNLVLVSLGYNTRFYRSIFVEELSRDHVRTARAFGSPLSTILFRYVLKNSMIPIITRIIFTIPFIFVGGSLVVETVFGIPGAGFETYNAIISGDLPIVKAMVGITAILYVVALTVTDILYSLVDPRVSIK